MPGRETCDVAGSNSFSSAEGAKRPRLFLLCNVRLYREGLAYSLERRKAFEILGASGVSDQSVLQITMLRPDAVILDMSDSQGFEVAKRLIANLAKLKVIAFGVREMDHLVLACAESGITAYVTPDSTEEDLVNAVQHALRGELSCSPRIAGLLFQRIGALSAKPKTPIRRDALTDREDQILNLLCEGKSNKEIGRALRISYATVKNHVHNILEKLEVRRRGEAAAYSRTLNSTFQRQPTGRT